MTSRRIPMNNLFTLSSDLDFGDSSHSTMRVDLEGLAKHRPVHSALSGAGHEGLPGPKIRSSTDRPFVRAGFVRFSRVLQVREVRHRNDMSPTELNEIWDNHPEFSPSIFDAQVEEAFPSWQEDETKRKRRWEALQTRRKLLAELAKQKWTGNGIAVISQSYTQYSARSAQAAHVAALRHAHSVEEEAELRETGSTPGPGPFVQRKRLPVSQPLAAVKRLRLSR